MNISIVRLVWGFLSNKRGSVAYIFAIALIPVMFSVGLAVDYSSMNRAQSRLQIAADDAALYAIGGYSDGGFDEDDIDELARKMVLTTYDIDTSDVDINLDKTVSTLGVSLKTNYNPAFMGIAGYETVSISAFAKVKYETAKLSVKCFIALDENSSDALNMVGNSIIGANACAVHINSASTGAVDLDGDSSINAQDVCIGGGVASGLNRISPTPSKCSVISDPFDNVTMPSVGSCEHNDFKKNNDGSVDPGVYCGGISIGGNAKITFTPGLYIIKDGEFKTTGTIKFKGEGVTFFFTGNDIALNLSGGTTFDLTAMSTGDLKGFIFYFDPNSDLSSTSSQFSGDSSTYFEGIMYFGKQRVDMNGSGAVNSTSPFSVIVADTIKMNGNASVTLNVDPANTDLEVPDELYYRDISGRLIE